jgi:prespore-specific regulator
MDRKDNWIENEDRLLADTVLKHIREGSTQLKAFDEAAERLRRTSAACGFRWNSEVRKNHEEAIRTAKQARYMNKKDQSRNKETAVVHQHSKTHFLPLESLMSQVTQYIRELEEKVARQQSEIKILKEKLEREPTDTLISEDMHNLMKILQHARELGYIERAN